MTRVIYLKLQYFTAVPHYLLNNRLSALYIFIQYFTHVLSMFWSLLLHCRVVWYVSLDEQAQLLLDHTCNSEQSFNTRGIRQARWSPFAAGRNRWLQYILHHFLLCASTNLHIRVLQRNYCVYLFKKINMHEIEEWNQRVTETSLGVSVAILRRICSDILSMILVNSCWSMYS